MTHHLGLESTQAQVAIICGAPERVQRLSSLFTNAIKVTDKRGFVIYQVENHGKQILIVSTGIGGPSIAIAVEELIDLGIRAIIRVGTCGSLFSSIKPGHVVIPNGVVRDEGTSRQYLDLSFPAVPDPYLLGLFLKYAHSHPYPHRVGITHCKDAYYMEKPQYQVNVGLVQSHWQTLRNAGVLATEMEASTLFVLGSLRKVITGALFINVGKKDMPNEEQRALEWIVGLIKDCLQALLNRINTENNISPIRENISFLDN